MCFLRRAAGRGLPGGNSLSFASPKESKQRKGDPGCCVPSLRYGQPAVLGPDGVKNNSPSAQTSFCPDPSGPPLLGASTRGGEGIPNSNTEYLKKQGLAKASPCLSWFVLWYLSSVPAPACPVLAGPRSADVGGSGIALFERSAA